MSHRLALQYVEIDIPAFDQGDSPPNSPVDSPPVLETYRFVKDTAYLPSDIDAIPSIVNVQVSPAIISLGENLGQRATVTVNFRDHKHIFVAEDFASGTFWGKFRARYGLKLQGRELRLIQGFVGQQITDMETRTYIIESTDGPTTDGRFKIVAKDLFKLADGDRAQAPVPSGGFLITDIGGDSPDVTTITLSPSGIGDDEYPTSGFINVGGKEIMAFRRAYGEPANDSFVKILVKMTAGGDSPTEFADTNAGGSAHSWVADGNANALAVTDSLYGTFAGTFDGSGDWVRTNDSVDFTLGTSNFTFDVLCKRGTTATRWLFGQCNSAASAATMSVVVGFNASNQIQAGVSIAAAVTTMTGTTAVTDTTIWHQVALSRSGSIFQLWLDGVQEATFTDAGSITDSANQFRIGAEGESTTAPWLGQLQHFRLSVGTTRHTSAYDVIDDYPATGTTTGDTLFITRAQYNTELSDHEAQSRVQVCLEYVEQDVADIIYDLMVTYADVDSSLIPLTTWQDETAEFLNVVYSALIPEPTAVNKLISELVEQAGLVVWWDELSATFRLQVLRAISTAAQVYDAEIIVADTLKVTEQPGKRLSQVYTYFAKINPLLNQDQLENYRSTAFSQDTDAEFEYGAVAVKKIYSRWIPTGGRSVATTVNDILLSRFRDPPRRINFHLFRDESGDIPMLGGGYQIEAWPFQEQDGTAALVPVQLTSVNALPDKFEVEAEEMLFTVVATSPDNHIIVIDSNLNNVNLREIHDSIYSTPISGDTVTCTITAGVTVGSTVTGTAAEQAAFYIGDWPAGVSINIILLGRLQGKGGAGGNGAPAAFSPPPNGSAGSTGGTALYTRETITLTAVDGEIWGGGGGGGGGGGFSDLSEFAVGGDGGNGGAGTNPGAGGTGSFGTTGTGVNGNAGSATAGGTPPAGGDGANGGAGGGPGLAGSNGSNSTSSGGAGGTAGRAIDGISFITFDGSSPSGDIRGGQVN